MREGDFVTSIPLLAGLPRVELAKLMGDLESFEFQAGEAVTTPESLPDWMYFIVYGEIQISYASHGRTTTVQTLGQGEMLGPWLVSATPVSYNINALTPLHVCRLPAKKLRQLVGEPAYTQNFMHLLNARLATTTSDLARTKHMLSSYAEEIWESMSPLPLNVASILPLETHSASVVERTEQTERPSRRINLQVSPRTLRATGHVLGFALAAVAFYLQPGTLRASTTVAILVWSAWNWLLGTIPDYVVALVTSTLIAATGIVAPATAFSGFANSGWFLLLGVLGLGVAVSRSGLLYRVSLHMLRLLPPSYRGQSFALALTGVLFTPLLPSANSRMAMVSPLIREISEAMRFQPRSRGSAGLAMSGFLGFGQMFFIFLNTNTCMLAWSLLPEAIRHQMTWGVWLWLSLPLGLITFVGCFVVTHLMFPPEKTPGISRQTITAQLQVLGPLNRTERATLVVMGAVLLGLITQSWHGVDQAWIALAGFLLLICLGTVDKNGLKMLDWGFLMLVGSLIGLSDVIKETGLSNELTSWVGPILEPLRANPYLFLAAVSLLVLIVRLAIPLQQAVMVMIISLLPLGQQIGYHPLVLSLVVLAISNPWILPQQNTVYLTIFSGTDELLFSHRQVRPLALAHAVVGVLAVLISVPFWQLLGLVPR